MKAMAAEIDSQSGGPGKGWLQIAYTPEQAYQAIADNKLAVVLGVEVDSLGNWRSVEDLEKACGGNLDKARELIGKELDWLQELGVRQVTPIHLSNNAFGGTAIYMRFLEIITMFLSGDRWTVEDAWQSGVRYRLDRDGDDLLDDLERSAAIAGPRLRAMHRKTLLDHIPGVRDLYDTNEAPSIQGGHANARGLNQYGQVLLDEMMKRGMILDLDHMSEKATDQALNLAEQRNYPVICSHSWFRDLLFSGSAEFDSDAHHEYGTSDVHKVAHEAGKRGDQVERIGRLGGVVAPIVNQGDIAGLRRSMPNLSGKISNPCAGSSTSWAQAYLYATGKMGGRGVAIGSDINGAAGLPGPRFGTFAAYGASPDARRSSERRDEIDCQTNGVAYSSPIRDYRWYRFEHSGAGGYDEDERDIWMAIAQYEAGFNPSKDTHPPSDFPSFHLSKAPEAVKVRYEHRTVDEITRGFLLAEQAARPKPRQLGRLAHWEQVAYIARKGIVGSPGIDLDDQSLEHVGKITAILKKWQEMKGRNRPMVRSTAGERRDFDINLDGMAHYGMLPDLLQDICNSGLTSQDLVPLFRSAYDYVEMWKVCEERAKED